MSGNKVTVLIKYGVTVLAAGLMTWATLSLHGFAQAQAAVDRYRILADAFTIPGLFLILLGALVWVARQGTFDGLRYSLGYVFKRLIPFGATDKPEKYYDYVEKRKEKRKQSGSYAYLFVVGGAFMAAAILFMILFYRIYNG